MDLRNSLMCFGTFNPVHRGHVELADAARKEIGADKVVFVPTPVPPHKDTCKVSIEDRLEMARLATQGNPAFEVSDIELRLSKEEGFNGKSYSYNTVRRLIEENFGVKLPESLKLPDEIKALEDLRLPKINFFMGADEFQAIDKWHRPDELARLIRFVINSRPGNEEVEKILPQIKLKNFEYRITKFLMDVSSSDIRDRVRQGLSIAEQVYKPVADYILKHNLYR